MSAQFCLSFATQPSGWDTLYILGFMVLVLINIPRGYGVNAVSNWNASSMLYSRVNPVAGLQDVVVGGRRVCDCACISALCESCRVEPRWGRRQRRRRLPERMRKESNGPIVPAETRSIKVRFALQHINFLCSPCFPTLWMPIYSQNVIKNLPLLLHSLDCVGVTHWPAWLFRNSSWCRNSLVSKIREDC